MAQYSIDKAPDIMRAIEVCALFGISQRTLYRWIKYLDFPVRRAKGRKPLFDKVDCLKWYEQNNRL